MNSLFTLILALVSQFSTGTTGISEMAAAHPILYVETTAFNIPVKYLEEYNKDDRDRSLPSRLISPILYNCTTWGNYYGSVGNPLNSVLNTDFITDSGVLLQDPAKKQAFARFASVVAEKKEAEDELKSSERELAKYILGEIPPISLARYDQAAKRLLHVQRKLRTFFLDYGFRESDIEIREEKNGIESATIFYHAGPLVSDLRRRKALEIAANLSRRPPVPFVRGVGNKEEYKAILISWNFLRNGQFGLAEMALMQFEKAKFEIE